MQELISFSDISTLATTTGQDQTQATSLRLADGRLFIVWRSDGTYIGESVLRARIVDGEAIAEPADFAVLSREFTAKYGTNTYTPMVQQLGNGNIFVAYSSRLGDGDGTCVLGTLLSTSGVILNPQMQINTAAKNNQLLNDLIKLDDGRVMVTFYSDQNKAGWLSPGSMLRARIYDEYGNPSGRDFALDSLTDGVTFRKMVSLPDGEMLAIYTRDPDHTGIAPDNYYMQRYDAHGDATGLEMALATHLDGVPNSIGVTRLENGNLLFSFGVGEQGPTYQNFVRGRLMGPDGAFLGDDFDILSVTPGFRDRGPVIGAFANGQMFMAFLRSWETWAPGTGYSRHSAVFGAVLSESGDKIGDIFQISDPAMRDSGDPKVTMLDDGRVFVSWTTQDGIADGSGTAVQGRYFFQGNGVHGTEGADILLGGQGSDIFYVNDSADRVIEHAVWSGIDVVFASVDFRMATSHVEKLYLTGAAVLGVGNGLENVIVGNDLGNVLDGGKNNDTMIGGLGNDIYFLRVPGDIAVEKADQGIDTVKAFYSLTLGDNIENLYLQTVRYADGRPVQNMVALGNALDNVIIGNPFDNIISGRGGNDTLRGQGGADTFLFDFMAANNGVDTIQDFAPEDTIKLRASYFGIPAGVLAADMLMFSFVAKERDDRIIYDQTTGNLWLDMDGSGNTTPILFANLSNHPTLSADDFLIF